MLLARRLRSRGVSAGANGGSGGDSENDTKYKEVRYEAFRPVFQNRGTRELGGDFTGHAAIFENVDAEGDVIESGAFRESLSRRNVVPLL